LLMILLLFQWQCLSAVVGRGSLRRKSECRPIDRLGSLYLTVWSCHGSVPFLLRKILRCGWARYLRHYRIVLRDGLFESQSRSRGLSKYVNLKRCYDKILMEKYLEVECLIVKRCCGPLGCVE